MRVKTSDSIFTWVESEMPPHWGRILDAGTGNHSLSWLLGHSRDALTAVTASESMARDLERRLALRLDPSDRIVVGDWSDAARLPVASDSLFEMVVADYLFGAVDRFAPYRHGDVFDRVVGALAPGGLFVVVGLEPWPDRTKDPDASLVLELLRLKDAGFLVAGERLYREYPKWWMERELAARGLRVVAERDFTISCNQRFIDGHLKSARNGVRGVTSPHLARALSAQVDDLRERLGSVLERRGSIPFGSNYAMIATR